MHAVQELLRCVEVKSILTLITYCGFSKNMIIVSKYDNHCIYIQYQYQSSL